MKPKSLRFVVPFFVFCLPFLILQSLIVNRYSSLAASVPPQISYQGKVTDTAGVGITDTLDIGFSLWNSDVGGDSLWNETQLAVPIIRGLFDVQLGTVNPIALSFDTTYWLQIIVDGDLLLPRTQLTTNPYAYRAMYADYLTGATGVYGSGMNHYLAKWSGTGSLETSMVYQAGSNDIGIGTVMPQAQVHIAVDLDSILDHEAPVFDFEADSIQPFFNFEGNDADWFITSALSYSGRQCLQSGALDSVESSMIAYYSIILWDDTIKFAFKLSCGDSARLAFQIGEDYYEEWTGEIDWTLVSVPVSTGEYFFTWTYYRESEGTHGDGSAWIDLVSFVTDHYEQYSLDSAALYVDGLNFKPAALFMGGNVGIGVNDPTQKLDVMGEIQATGLNVTGEIQATGTGANCFAGKVGIGNTAPGTFSPDFNDLVVGSDSGRNGITILTDSISRGALAFADGASGTSRYSGLIYYDNLNNGMYLTTNGEGWADGGQVFVIDSQGNVGIGIDKPVSFYTDFNDLVVGNGSGRHGITIYSDSLARGMLAFAKDTFGTAAYNGLIYYNHVVDKFFITTNGEGYVTEESKTFAIDRVGNVGIGVLSPERKLHVRDVMRLEPRSTVPSSPSKGDMYFDSNENKLKVYDGTTWQPCW
ncbi:hypothetical protein JXI42_04460 [bacterium]|nr:hypothetical protein [bacterium]